METSTAGGDGFTLPYATLLGLGALDAAGYSMIGPVAPEIAAQTHASTLMIGALVASFPFGIALGFVLAGFGITHRRDRQVLLISLLAVAIGASAFVVSTDLATLFAGRLVMGVGSGGVWMAVTFSTLERWPGQEYLCMGRIFAAYSVGGLVGPAIGGVGGIRTPFALYLALTTIATVLAAMMTPPQRRRTFHADRSALRLPGFWAASAGILFAVLALGIVDGVLPLHFAERLSQAQIGIMIAGVAALNAGAAVLSARYRPAPAVSASLALVIVGTALASGTGQVPVWVAGLALLAIGIGLGNTGSIGVLFEAVGNERIVTAMLVWSQIGIAGYLIGPLAGGAIVQAFGFSALVAVPALAAAAVAASLRLSRRGATLQ